MKAAIISSLYLAATGALAVPTKRAGQAVTITGLKATYSDQQGSVQFSLWDPNYSDSTSASLNWDRPGQPPAESWSADHNYVVKFPNGVNYEQPTWLSFVIKRTGGVEEIDVALGSNADASQWGCHKEEGTQVCIFTGDLIVTPYSP
ncbi:unnamed protein product [Penicillium manginii]